MPEFLAEVDGDVEITANVAATPGSLTDDYQMLQNLPQINGITLTGNKSTSDLDIALVVGSSSVTDWVQGGLSSSTGASQSATTRCRTDIYISFSTAFKVILTVKSGFKVTYREYTEAGTAGYTSGSSWNTGIFILSAPIGKYYRFSVAYTGDGTITPSDVPADVLTYVTYADTDGTVSVTGKAADAGMTGAKITNINNTLKVGNAYNIINDAGMERYQSSGIRFNPQPDGSVKVDGTATSDALFFPLWHSSSSFPSWIEKGRTYHLVVNDTIIRGEIQYYTTSWTVLLLTYTEGDFTVPDDDSIVGFSFRFRIGDQSGNTISKVFTPYCFNNMTNEGLTDAVQELLDGERVLPGYWKSYMATKIPVVQGMDDAHPIGDSFAFITDIHWESNAKNSPSLIRKVCNSSSVKKVFCGGDLINYYANKAEAIATMNSFLNEFDNMLTACGNHDDNGESTSATTAERMYADQRYGVITRKANPIANTGSKTYYSYINESDSIAYIILDTTDYTISDNQLAWLSAEITSLYEDYHIVIIMHAYYEPDGTSQVVGTEGTKLDTLLSGLSSSVVDKIIAIFCGHIHCDKVFRTSTDIPIIITQCDAYAKVNEDRGGTAMTLGTTTEQAFDIVHIDLTAEKIYCTRIGSGSDREVAFRTS